MEVELPPTVEECHVLIKHLLTAIEQLQAEFQATQTRMQAEIDELKAQLSRHSGNSNQPPSSDGFKRGNKSAMPKKKGRRGGQAGHLGKTLRMIQEPDVVEICEPEGCVCGASVWVGEGRAVEKRQVFDLPEQRLEVTEYRRVIKACKCGRKVSGKFPEEVSAPVQYGRRVQAMTSLLSVHGCLSFGKIGQFFSDLYSAELNQATVQKMIEETAKKMPGEQIRAALIASERVNFDESGIKENGKLKWLHNASTEKLTYQFVHLRRGKEALESEKSVFKEFKAVAVHDCWGSYFGFTQMEHAICNAHLLRELTGIIENSRSKWGFEMRKLLVKMYHQSDQGKGIIQEIGKYEKKYEAILKSGDKEEPPPKRTSQKGKWKRTKGRNLLERMSKYRESVLLFAKRKEVPFTNNQAERDIRPLKVKQKVCGSFRSATGSESYAEIHSFISTMRKLKRQVFKELTEILEGKPFVLFQT